MEVNSSIGTTPLPLQIKDTLSCIFGQMPLKTIGQCSRVSKRWKEVTNGFLLLEELSLEPKNNMPAYEFASMAIKKFQFAKKIKLPKSIYGYNDLTVEERDFFQEHYPKGVKNVTALTFPPTMIYAAEHDKRREELAKLILDPLPKTCEHFDFVSFWPEIFDKMNANHSARLRSLDILLNTPGKVSGSWDSFIRLIENSTRLEALGLHYYVSASFYNNTPNFNVMTDNLIQVLNSASQLQHLNIPFNFNIDKVVEHMQPMPHLTYLYVQERMTNSRPNTLLEKCKNLRLLHLQLNNPNEPYTITSKSIQTLLINATANLKSLTIECPNLEVLNLTGALNREINEVHLVGEHRLEEFTSKVPISGGLYGNFDSVKVANHNTLFPSNHEQAGLMSNLQKLTLACEAPKTQLIYDTIETLTRLVNLKNLELVKVKRFATFGAISQLTKLVLRDCNTFSKDIQFMNLTNLKDLQLIQSSEITSVKISGCPQLTNLVLFGNEHLRTLEIRDSPNIEEIDVGNCWLNLSSWRQIEKLTKLKTISALIIPMSSYIRITEHLPTITISGKKMMDRVYSGGVTMIGTPINWISKEEYDESGPGVGNRKVY